MNTCCHFFKARTGAYIISILGIIFDILGLGISLVEILDPENLQNGVKYVFYFSIAGSMFHIIFGLELHI